MVMTLLFSFFFKNHIKNVFVNKLMITYEVALHEGNPFVFGSWKVAKTNFPEKGSHRIILINKSVTVMSVMLHHPNACWTLFIKIFLDFKFFT